MHNDRHLFFGRAVTLSLSVTVFCASATVYFASLSPAGATSSSHKQSSHHTGFFERHPKLKKLLVIGGIGAATGGVGAAIMGTGVATGAAVGAGTHIGAHEAVEKYKEHKAHNKHGKMQGQKQGQKHGKTHGMKHANIQAKAVTKSTSKHKRTTGKAHLA